MITAPRAHVSKRAIRIMIDTNDCKKWIVAKEKGKMDTSIGKSESNQATQDSSNGASCTSQQHTSKKPREEWMNHVTKPRRDNTCCIQTELKF